MIFTFGSLLFSSFNEALLSTSEEIFLEDFSRGAIS